MAAIHDFLYRSKNFSRIDVAAYLQTLCVHLFRSFGAAERRLALDLDVDKLELDLEFAVPVGLLVNELVTNALKHAFPDGRAGRVRVELHRQGEEGFVLAVRDDGVGLPADAELRQARSLGLRLVQTLSRQIRGTLETSRVGGTGFTVVVPQPSAKEPLHGQDQSVAGGG
jgi:two-component sensor histidine kinase